MSLELIWGPMFSSKTTTLLQKLIREASIGCKVLYINSILDTRSDKPYSTHNPLYKDTLENIENVTMISCDTLPNLEEICKYESIYIDEAQMFENLDIIISYVEKLHKHVCVSGLVGYASRQPFGNIVSLIPYADKCTVLQAICRKCREEHLNNPAIFTHKINNNNDNIDIGGDDKYTAVCRKHYMLLNK